MTKTPGIRHLGVALAASFLIAACSSPATPKPNADASRDASSDRGTGHDVGVNDKSVNDTSAPDTPVSPDLSSGDMAPFGDIGVAYTGIFPPNPAIGDFTIVPMTVDGVKRSVTIYAPAGWKKHMPLIIACPSTDTNGEDGVWDIAANEVADQEKMLVISVEPSKKAKGDWDQHIAGEAYFDTYPNESFATNNDLKLVLSVIAEARRVYAIDTQRVFTAGYSNGAFFAQFAAFHLPNRIAGFAAAGGGLVRCDGTFDCIFNGATATPPTCSVMAKMPGWCGCDAADKPGAIPTTGRKPAAYLDHAANDDVVSIYYDCELFDRLTALKYPVKLNISPKGGHNAPPHFMVTAWAWLSTFKLP